MDQRILEDSVYICDLKLSQLRLMKDGDLDWFLLMPKKDNATEIIDLSSEEQIELMQEIDYVSRKLKELTTPDKINVASLGNVVSDLHIHVLSRYKNDRAWPAPIWGTRALKEFNTEKINYWKNVFEI